MGSTYTLSKSIDLLICFHLRYWYVPEPRLEYESLICALQQVSETVLWNYSSNIYIYLYIITYYLWRSDKHINSIIISDDDHHDHQNIYFPYIYTYIYIYRITNNLKSSYIHPKIFSWSVFSDDIISIYRKQFHYIIFYIQWIHDSWYIVYIYRDETIHN